MIKRSFISQLLTFFVIANSAQAMQNTEDLLTQIQEKATSLARGTGFNFTLSVEEKSVDISLVNGGKDSDELRKIYAYIARNEPSFVGQILLSNGEMEEACSLTSEAAIPWFHDEPCDCWCKAVRAAIVEGIVLKDNGRQNLIFQIINWFQPVLKANDDPLDLLSFEFSDRAAIKPFLELLYKALQDIF